MVRLIAVLIAFTLLTTGVATVAAQAVVGPGTVFEASDSGPTVEITEELELDSPFDYPDGNTVDLSPKATFESSGDTNVTVDSIDGTRTKLTIHDVSSELTVDPHDKQAITVSGSDIDYLHFESIAANASTDTEIVYKAGAAFDLTITDLPANESLQAINDSGTILDSGAASSDGVLNLSLPAGDQQLGIREEPSGGGGGGGGGISTGYEIETDSSDSTDSTDSTAEDESVQVSIQGYEIGDELSVPTENVGTDSVGVEEVSVSFDMGTNIQNEMSVRSNDEPPENVPPVDDTTAADYVSVDIEGNLADRVVSGSITVRLAEEKIPDDPSEVTAQHYTNGDWEPAEMNHLGGQRFEIRTTEYSTFAIVMQQQEAETTTRTTTATTTTTTPPTTVPETTTEQTTAESETSVDTTTEAVTTTQVQTTSTESPGFGFVVILVAILGLTLLIRRGG